MSLLEQDIRKKGQGDKKLEIELEFVNNIKYKVEAVQDSTVYARKLAVSHLPGFYYLIS